MAAPTEAMAQLALKTTPAAPKLAKGKKGTVKKVVTNSFPVTLRDNIPFYLHDFRIHAVFAGRNGEEKLKEITKQTNNDFEEQERKKIAVQVLFAMRANNHLQGPYSYDRAALYISMKEIPQCKGGAEFKTTLTAVTAPQAFALAGVREAKEVRVTIKKASDSYQVTSNDLSSTNEATQKAILSVINLGTSQRLFESTTEYIVYGNGNAYLLEPEAHGFADFDVGSSDKFGGVGLTKGARLVEGPNGKAAPAITVDPKKTAFHRGGITVQQKLIACGCAGHAVEATQIVTGLSAEVVYAGQPEAERKYRKITIGMVSTTLVRDVVLEVGGRRVTLVQYVRDKYRTALQHTNAFAIVDKYNNNFYAPETLIVCENQRVKSENATPAVTERLIRSSATVPSQRLAETHTLARCMDAGANNPAQVARGMTANTTTPIVVEARQQAPIMLGSGGLPQSVTGQWRQQTIAQPALAQFAKWSVVHLIGSQERNNLAGPTAQALIRYARDIGYTINMELSTVCEQFDQRDQEKQLERIISREKEGGSKFVLLICHASIKNHDSAKMLENELQIIVQQIKSVTAEKIAAQPVTGSNVMKKMVEKLGGQNNYISRTTPDLPAWVTQKGTMICGLQMQHPSSLTGREREANTLPSRPVCIGYSVNAVRGAKEREAAAKSPQEKDAQNEKESTHFASYWNYALPKDYKNGAEYWAGYRETVLAMLRSYKKYRDAVPMKIVLFRGGVPEGDYEKIRREEAPIWEEAFTIMNAKYSPNFIIITANQMHSDRFYQERINKADKAPKQNLPPGTVISTGVTNPALSSSFVQTHSPLQGTAKVPLYVVQYIKYSAVQKMTFSMDDVERMVYALACAHGVCNSPTSIPTPLYVAQESMKRAVEQFNYWQRRTNKRNDWNIDEVKQALNIDGDKNPNHGLRLNA